jgi:hypothetical protein
MEENAAWVLVGNLEKEMEKMGFFFFIVHKLIKLKYLTHSRTSALPTFFVRPEHIFIPMIEFLVSLFPDMTCPKRREGLVSLVRHLS